MVTFSAFKAAATAAILLAMPNGTAGQYWIPQLKLEQAWQLSNGAGVRVGVVDTGVNSDHPDLTGAVLPGKAFPELEDGLRDSRGHGTNVAVLIAGRGAIRGVAPEAMVLPAKFTGGGRAANDAIIWAVDNGAKVINLSLGGHSRAGEPEPYDAGLRYAKEHDVVLVAAAGNAATDRQVVSPANRPGVVAVSAVDSSGRFRPDISVAGPEVALAAPGTGMPLQPGNGTSYAAAIVSGAAALVRAKFPDLDAASVVDRLTTTARKPSPGDRDPQYGYGVVDPVAALTAPLGESTDFPWLPAGIPMAVALCAGSWWFLRRRRRTSRRASPRR
jgi:subtilisin family serine protease